MAYRSGEIIVSTANPLIKQVRSLLRRKTRYQERAFVVEGFRAVQDALGANADIRHLIVTESALKQHTFPLEAHTARVVSDAVFRDISNVEAPQGILAVVGMPAWDTFDGWASRVSLAVVADGLRDPGNLGTLLRSAAGAGVDFLVTADASVDPFNPKVVRSAMGAHFRLPIYQETHERLDHVLAGVDQVVIAEADGDVSYDEIDFRRRTVLVIGGEAEGPLGHLEHPHTVRARIPLARGVESLNAGVAGSLLVFEAARQRRTKSPAN